MYFGFLDWLKMQIEFRKAVRAGRKTARIMRRGRKEELRLAHRERAAAFKREKERARRQRRLLRKGRRR